MNDSFGVLFASAAGVDAGEADFLSNGSDLGVDLDLIFDGDLGLSGDLGDELADLHILQFGLPGRLTREE